MSRGIPALPRRDDFSRCRPSHEHDLHDARSPHTARPRIVHRERGALSARAARPLLPDARLLRGVRGPRPGDLPARVAPASDVRGPFLAPRLAPLQRAVLILRDVLGLSAKETASVLETSVPAVNSALQRARAAMGDHLPERREEWPSGTDVTAAERELLDRYVEYSEGPDPIALKRLLSEDVRFSMPPQPGLWEGREDVVQSWIDGGFGSEAFGSLRCLVTRANRQPAVANYVRKPGDEGYTPMALDVVRIVDGKVADIVTFDGSVFPWFGLPESL